MALREWNIIIDATESNTILQSIIYQSLADFNTDGVHTSNGYWTRGLSAYIARWLLELW